MLATDLIVVCPLAATRNCRGGQGRSQNVTAACAAAAPYPPIGADDRPVGQRSRCVQIWNSGAVWQTAISWLARMRPSSPTTTGCSTATSLLTESR